MLFSTAAGDHGVMDQLWYLPKCADLQVILCLADAVFCAVEDHQSWLVPAVFFVLHMQEESLMVDKCLGQPVH